MMVPIDSVTPKTYKMTYYIHNTYSTVGKFGYIVFPLILAAILDFWRFSQKPASFDLVNKWIRTQRPKIHKNQLFNSTCQTRTTEVHDMIFGPLPNSPLNGLH